MICSQSNKIFVFHHHINDSIFQTNDPFPCGVSKLQVLKQKNLFVFIGIAFAQSFDCTFQKNFFSIYIDLLLASEAPPWILSCLITSGFIVPHCLTLIITPILQKRDVSSVFSSLFSIKWVLQVMFGGIFLQSIVFNQSKSVSWPIFALYLFFNRVETEFICRLFPLVTSDLADEDRVMHVRTRSMSAMVNASINLFTKPAQSLAPMLGWTFFHYIQESGEFNRSQLHNETAKVQAHHNLVMFSLVSVPFVCVSVQWILWKFYTLHGRYLKNIKHNAIDLARQSLHVWEENDFEHVVV